MPEEFTHSQTLREHSHQSHTLPTEAPRHSIVDHHRQPITDESSRVGPHTHLMETEERHSELRKPNKGKAQQALDGVRRRAAAVESRMMSGKRLEHLWR